MNTVQERGRVLSAMAFATNGGDTHVCLDMVKEAKIRAKDFRIRCLFEGAIRHLKAEQVGAHTFVIVDTRSGLRLTIDFPYAAFGDMPIRYEITEESNMLGIDAVLHHGEVREIDFSAMQKALIVTTIDICDNGKALTDTAVCTEENGCLRAAFADLAALTPLKPDASRAVYGGMRLWRHDAEYKPAF